MDNENKSNSNKGFLNIILGVIIGIVIVTAYFKITDFFEERRLQQRVMQTNIEQYNQTNQQQTTENNVVNNGEPTDLPPYEGSQSETTTNSGTTNQQVINDGTTWNGQTLIGIDSAKDIAIQTIGGGEVIFQEEDVYDIDDAPTYDFKIQYNNKVYEIEIDALTGAVKDYDID